MNPLSNIGTGSYELRELNKLEEDLVTLRDDMKKEVMTIRHADFREKFLDVFLERPSKYNYTFIDWYNFTGHRSTYVNVIDNVNGVDKLVYRVPPLLNREGLSTFNYRSGRSIAHLLSTAITKAGRLPLQEFNIIEQHLAAADMDKIGRNEEAVKAWRDMLIYNGELTESEKATVIDEVSTLEYTSTEISWDEDPWEV